MTPRLPTLCGNCLAPLEISLHAPVVNGNCPICRAPVEAHIFPAQFREKAEGHEAQTILVEGESACFYHADKKAAAACETCGRFLCALCDIELKGQHLCVSCIQAGASKGKMAHLKRDAILYDEIALAVAVLPLLIFYFTFITAPAAIVLTILWWKKPLGVLPRRRWRFVLAFLIALAEVAGWIIGIAALLEAW